MTRAAQGGGADSAARYTARGGRTTTRQKRVGALGDLLAAEPAQGANVAHPDYFPIYEVASDLEVPVCVHEGARTV